MLLVEFFLAFNKWIIVFESCPSIELLFVACDIGIVVFLGFCMC